jgi:hypothetical protein
MVFGPLSRLLSLLSSAVAYIIGAIVFSGSKEEIVTFFAALIVLFILLFLIRLFFPKHHNLRNMFLKYRMQGGRTRTGFMRFFTHEQQRQVISSSVARIIMFGLILYTFHPSLLYVYIALGFAFLCGIIMMIAHRHRPVDLVTGAVFGFGIGYLAIEYAPLIKKVLGF